MPTTTVSIGSNQSIDTRTPSTSGGSGPSYTIGFTSTPTIKSASQNGIAVGDIATMDTDEAGANGDGINPSSPSTYTYLVTAISSGGNSITVKYISDTGLKGDASPVGLYTGNGSSGSPEQADMVFKRAFTSISTFEAMVDDVSPTLFGSTDDVIGELHADSTFTEGQVTFNSKQSLASVTLTSNEFDRHDGTAESGALIKPTSSAAHNVGVIEVAIDDMTVSFLDISLDDGDSLTTNVGIELSSYDGVTVRSNLIHDFDGNPGGSGPYGIRMPASANDDAVAGCHNNIIYNIHETNGDHAYGIQNVNFRGTSYVDNNTIYSIEVPSGRTAHGYEYNNTGDDDANYYVRNNLIGGLVADATTRRRPFRSRGGDGSEIENNNCDFRNSSGQSSRSGNRAPGSNSLQNQTLAQVAFVSTTFGSEDLHLTSDSVCVDAGADLGTNVDSNYDIDGRDRDAEGDTWDIGADEFTETVDPPAVSAGPFIHFVD